MTYRITVKPIKGAEYLIFKAVSDYSVKDGFIHFIDQRTKKTKIFAVSNTEIEVEDEI